jgi:hypothetical protein
MDQEPSQAGPGLDDGERSPEQIQAEIDQTRRDLGETVAAVAEKADVKSQARQRVDEAKQAVQAKRAELMGKARENTPDSAGAGIEQVTFTAQQNPLPLAIGGALVIGFLFGRRARR